MSVGFHTLTVAEVVDETAEARSIRFAVPEELRETFKFKPGQHLTLKAEIAGEELRRNYSLCVAPQDDEVMVTVKRIAGGAFSNWANDNLKPGMAIEVMAPHGSFTWDFDEGAANHYVGFAGGSGITPVMSLLKTALLTEPESRFTLFYGNRDSCSVIFLEALAQLEKPFHGPAASPSFPCRRGRGIRAVQRHARSRQMRRDPGEPGRPGRRRRLLHLRPRPDDGRGRGGADSARRRPDRIHLERFTAGRPSAALEAQMQALTKEAAGLTMLVTLDGRKRRVAFDAAAGNILDQRPRLGPAGAVRLQGRRLRDLPGAGGLGRGRDGGALRPHRRGGGGGLRAHLPVGAQGRRRRARLRRLSAVSQHHSSTAMSASVVRADRAAGPNQVWVQLIMPKNSMVSGSVSAPRARAGSRATTASTARDDPALLGDDFGAARRRQVVELVQQHLVAVLRADIEAHEGDG